MLSFMINITFFIQGVADSTDLTCSSVLALSRLTEMYLLHTTDFGTDAAPGLLTAAVV